MAKPIVTTNHRGCKETVDEGRNGYLVPIKNSEKLAEKIEILMNDHSLRVQFGKESRKKGETEFNEALVVQRVMHQLYGLDCS
jgi:N,N'-diacetylbacillosaminyl-diphospho-undecaprenol alpha-1,3-N-acetylgalactosaminyltransferase